MVGHNLCELGEALVQRDELGRQVSRVSKVLKHPGGDEKWGRQTMGSAWLLESRCGEMCVESEFLRMSDRKLNAMLVNLCDALNLEQQLIKGMKEGMQD